METEPTLHQPRTCPDCGAQLGEIRDPPVPGARSGCPSCAEPPATEGSPSHQTSPAHEGEKPGPRSRLRGLLQEAPGQQPEVWPKSLIEALPEEARRLLVERSSRRQEKSSPTLREETASLLRSQGLYVTEDARGLRFTGGALGEKGEKTDLSPLDIVRMAAELDGGVLSKGQRQTCPACQAVARLSDEKCQWCDAPLTPPDPDQG